MNPARFPLSNTLLTLPTPNTPDATQSVVGGNVGVPLRIYDLTPMGLKVVVAPYLDQAPGDTIWLHLNFHVFLVSEQTETATSETILYLPKKLLLAGIVNQLTYTVIRASENKGTSDPPLAMLYNAVRPGDVDTAPGTGGHSQLELILPDAIKNGVGPDFPVAGVQVCVSYPFCRAYDRIWLNCNGHAVLHTVTPDEAPPPPDPGSDIPTRVCLTVTRADLELGKDSQRFNLSYTVTDQVGNNPDPNNPWSAEQLVDVDLAGNRLPMPLLREILNEAGDDPSTIDLDKLGNNALHVVVLTADSRFRPGDRVAVTYIAIVAGQEAVPVNVDEVVTTDSFGQNAPCILLVPNDKVPANAVVRVSYQLFRGDALIATSRTAHARVIGEGLPDLPAPALLVSVNNLFDPLIPANRQGATGRVEVLGYRPGDTVQLIVKGAPGAGSPTFAPQPLNTNSQADFPMDKAFVAANMGKDVTLEYVLFRNGVAHPSRERTVSISAIPNNHPDLPRPAIDGAAGNELNVGDLLPADQLRVSEWPHQVSGQPVWLRYEGVNEAGTAVTYDDREGEPHTSLPGFNSPVPLTWLRTLRNGSSLSIGFRVNYDGVANSATATSFPVRNYTVNALADVQPLITRVVGDGVDIRDGDDTFATSITVTGTATTTAGQKVVLQDDEVPIITVDVLNGTWTTTIPVALGQHPLTAKALYGSGLTSPVYTINRRVKLSMTWDFNDNTFQGWVPQGSYTDGELWVSDGVVMSGTDRARNYAGTVMAHVVQVVANQTYDVSFYVAALSTGPGNFYGTILNLTVNGAAIGAGVDTQNQVNVWKHGTGVYTATTTGAVTLGLFNSVSERQGNDFKIDNISITER